MPSSEPASIPFQALEKTSLSVECRLVCGMLGWAFSPYLVRGPSQVAALRPAFAAFLETLANQVQPKTSLKSPLQLRRGMTSAHVITFGGSSKRLAFPRAKANPCGFSLHQPLPQAVDR